jgi:heme exporter protein D
MNWVYGSAAIAVGTVAAFVWLSFGMAIFGG